MLSRDALTYTSPDRIPASGVLLAALRLSGAGVMVAVDEGPDMIVTWATPTLDRILGYDLGDTVGTRLSQVIVHPGGLGSPPTDLATLLTGQGLQSPVNLRRADGSTIAVQIAGTRVEDGDLTCTVITVERMPDAGSADARLQEAEARFGALAAQAPIGIFVSEVGLRLGFVNDRALQLWDRPIEVMQSPDWLEAVHPGDREAVITSLAGVLAGGEADVPLRIATRDGIPRSLRLRAAPVRLDGRGAGFIGSLEDTTAQLQHEEKLRHAALHDPLTGLPNRTLLDQKLDAAAADLPVDGSAPALLFFDLDDFKRVNDTLGHAAGDAVLVEVARRLSATLRAGDLLTRFGGDEFVVLCHAVPTLDVALAVAERMRARLEGPMRLDEHTIVQIGASVGVAMLDGPDDRPQELIRNADAAMYLAKRRGRGRVIVFEEHAHREALDRQELLADLRDALDSDALSLAWQPISALPDGSMAAVEVLVRWTHPTRGPIPADELVGLAEEHGLIGHLGEQVLHHACTQFARWHEQLPHSAPTRLCVNVSRQQLDSRLPDVIARELARTGLRGTQLILELTERTLLTDAEEGRAVLAQLTDMGIAIALDDFGTGYSSLGALVEHDVHVIKIDKSLVAGIEHNSRSRLLVKTVVDLGRGLDALIVAEGIETLAQLDAVKQLGCGLGQGYLLARPMPAAAMDKVLASGAIR